MKCLKIVTFRFNVPSCLRSLDKSDVAEVTKKQTRCFQNVREREREREKTLNKTKLNTLAFE